MITPNEIYLLIALAAVTWIFNTGYKGLDFIAILALFIIIDFAWTAATNYLRKKKVIG